jgi:hypothetical protein
MGSRRKPGPFSLAAPDPTRDAGHRPILGTGFPPLPRASPPAYPAPDINRKAPPMRALVAALLATTALPVCADTIAATSRITAVTVYPDGAKLTREVTFTAPAAGSHELLVTDLPYDSDPGLIRLAPSEGLQVGAFNLRADRLPPREDPLTPEQQAAKSRRRGGRSRCRPDRSWRWRRSMPGSRRRRRRCGSCRPSPARCRTGRHPTRSSRWPR